MTTIRFASALFVLAAILPAAAFAAAPDDNVEWNGVSHITWIDRAPVCPVDGEAFTVRFQTWRDDLTAARVSVDDGAQAWVAAVRTDVRGPYDVWSADVPATAAASLSYFVELTDGSDVDYLSVDGLTDAAPADGGFVVDFTTLSHAPMGATPLPGGGAVFRVWTPGSTSANVRGQFNGWGTGDALWAVGDDFVGRAASAAPGDMYKYWFDASHWNTDARAAAVDPSDNYNARIVDHGAYVWQTDDFSVPPFEEMVVYQLHVGTFAGENDPLGTPSFPAGYTDVADRVGHLAELGVNAVMLNPITEFPGDRSAGYNPVSQWAPEWVYGPPDEFKALVDALHAEGIAVLLDIVWNHFSSTDNFLWYYDGDQIYFDDPAVGTPWGDQADLDRVEVRDYYVDSALNWLDVYRVDGFRMDATSYLNIEPQEASGWALMQELNDVMDRRCADKIAIAEQLPDNSWVTRPTALGGAGFDSQYHDEFTDRLRDETFAAGYGDPSMTTIRGIIEGSGEYLEGRHVVNYLELHDECWPTSGGQRIVKSIDTTSPHDDQYAMGRSKLAQGLVLAAPGIPALHQGTEWLEDRDFGTDEGNRIDWSKKTTYAGVFDYYADLIALRTSASALRADAAVDVFHVNEVANVIAFQRYDGQGDVRVVVANFSNADHESYTIGLPQDGVWRETINSQAVAYMGDGPENPGDIVADGGVAHGFEQSADIALPGMGLIVLSPETTTAVEDGDDHAGESVPSAPSLTVRPNPFNPRTTVVFETSRPGAVRVAIFDAAGRRVRTLIDGSLAAGTHDLAWDGRDAAGADMPTGVYFVRAVGEGVSLTEKMVLLR